MFTRRFPSVAAWFMLALLMIIPRAHAADTLDAEIWVVSFGQQSPAQMFAPLRQKQGAVDRASLRAKTLKTWDATVQRDRAALLQRMGGQIKDGGITILRTWDHIPSMLVRATEEQAMTLEETRGVTSVRRQRIYHPQLNSSLRFLKAEEYWNVHGGGDGVAVAVIDTGVRFLDDFFGTCEEPGDEGCSVVHEEVFAGVDGPGLATHGIVTSGIVHGLAPQADIISLDVFFYTGRPSPEDYVTSDEYIFSALNWCIQNRDEYNIAAVNMNLGSGETSGFCNDHSYGSDLIGAIETLYAMDVVTAIASGNNGLGSRISWPACAYPGLAVGACSDSGGNAGNAAGFSNQASALAMMAPGVSVTAGGIGGSSGTSMAAPFVAGAAALWAANLQQKQYDEPLADAVLRRLQMTAASGGSNHSNYDWKWPVLQMLPVSELSEHQLVATGDTEYIRPGTERTWTFTVSKDGVTGVEKMTIGLDLVLSTTDDMTIVVTSPGGTEVSGNLPMGSSSSARIVLGSFYMPELSTAFLDENPNGQWQVTLQNDAIGSRAEILNFSVSMDTRGNDELQLLALRSMPEHSDFSEGTFGLEMDVYSMALSEVTCSADITMTGANSGLNTELQDVAVTIPGGAATLILGASLPEPLTADTYTIVVAVQCPGGTVVPAMLEAGYELTVQPLSIRAGKLASATALPQNKSVSYSYQTGNDNPWNASCTERLLRHDTGAELSTRTVELASGNHSISAELDVSGIWENGLQIAMDIDLECRDHQVDNSIPTLSFTMLEIPEATIVADPGLEGPAPFTVSLSADVTGIADQVKWTVGNDTELGETAAWTFEEPGDYKVRLKVTNSAGDSTTSATVTVTEPAPEPPKDDGGSGGGCSGGGMSSVLMILAAVALLRRRRF